MLRRKCVGSRDITSQNPPNVKKHWVGLWASLLEENKLIYGT